MFSLVPFNYRLPICGQHPCKFQPDNVVYDTQRNLCGICFNKVTKCVLQIYIHKHISKRLYYYFRRLVIPTLQHYRINNVYNGNIQKQFCQSVFKLAKSKVFAMLYTNPVGSHTRPNVESEHNNQRIHKPRRWG